MGIKITLNAGALDNLDKAVLRTAELTMEALKTDVVSGRVMSIQRWNYAECTIPLPTSGRMEKPSMAVLVHGTPHRLVACISIRNITSRKNRTKNARW